MGLGPLGFAKLRRPRPLRTTRRPSLSARTAVGYQPVGMKPWTWLRGWEISTTATAFASEQATYNLFRSALRPAALGVMPTGWRGVMDRLMVSSGLSSPVSDTATE